MTSLQTPNPPGEPLTEAEARAVAFVLHFAATYARRVLAGWAASGKRPKFDDMMEVALNLDAATNLMNNKTAKNPRAVENATRLFRELNDELDDPS